MIRKVLIYGLGLAAALIIFVVVERAYLSLHIPLEVYGGLIAIVFLSVGLLFNWQKQQTLDRLPPPIQQNPSDLGLSKRELEVLQYLALGHTNQQIADQLFVSLNTIKTHLNNLYSKLGVNRRTQAVQKARELGILA